MMSMVNDIAGLTKSLLRMTDMHARLAGLRSKLYETRPTGMRVDLHQLVPGRSWVLVGREGRRWWMKFLEHRDLWSIQAIDVDGAVVVLGRVHVLGVQTLSEQAVLLKLLSDKKI